MFKKNNYIILICLTKAQQSLGRNGCPKANEFPNDQYFES